MGSLLQTKVAHIDHIVDQILPGVRQQAPQIASGRREYSLSQTSMTTWIALNSTVRFLLELCALLALMYWGIHTGDSMVEGMVIGALAPGAAIFVWWKLVAPKSASWLTDTGRLLVEMAGFGLSALALAAAGQALLAISFAVVTILNASFLLVAPRS